MMMFKAGFYRFLVLFLGLNFVFSSLAVPTTRSLKSTDEEAYSLVKQDFQAQDALDFGDSGELMNGHMRGRKATDTTDDYPGTGANNHHDPKTPGYY